MDDALYREEVLDHYRSSAHRGRLDPADATGAADSPLCGDRVRVWLTLTPAQTAEGPARVGRVGFEGDGCALSQASASMLAERVEGLTVDEARAFTADDMLALLGVWLTPARVRCALLGWHALRVALDGLSPPSTANGQARA